MATKIIKCPRCKEHQFKDKTYGLKMRVHNWAEKAKKWRCTVCENEKDG